MAEQRWGVRKGAWTPEEDALLTKCIHRYGEGKWKQVPLQAGLNRCRKSCRLRWMNYLRPDIKRGDFAADEADLILRLHKLLGNRWVLIAGRIPGRTANDIKNYWNSYLSKLVADQVDANMGSFSKVIKPKPYVFKSNLIRQTINERAQLQTVQEQPLSTHSNSSRSCLFDKGEENQGLVMASVEGACSGTNPFEFRGEAAWDDLLIDENELWSLLEAPHETT